MGLQVLSCLNKKHKGVDMVQQDKVGVDFGYGFVKFAYYNESGEIVFGKFPSVVAHTKSNSVDLYTMDGRSYYVGEQALLQPSADIIEIVSYQELEQYSPIFMVHIENITGRKFSNLMCGLSLAQRSQVENFRAAMSHFNVNGDQNYKVAMTPQAVGAAECIKAMIQDDPASNKHIMIIDFGTHTLDIAIIIDGVIRADRLVGYEGRGVVLTAKPIQQYIKETFNKEISMKEALRIVDNGFYQLRGVKHDLSTVVDAIKVNYTNETMQFLEAKYSDDIDKADRVFCVGGGAYCVDPNYSANMVIPKDAEFFNAYGNLLMI